MAVHQTHLSHPKYRPDIDGLRALAVLAVVAFHAFPYWVKGGFIGVDVFFVISGYLISTIIFENLGKGSFSVSEFYARRIRRIFPALFVVIAACFFFGWFELLTDEYKQLGKHMAAGAGFVANYAFWSEAGYFDNSADTKPLLHLWSLGVEEQFYIGLAIVLMILGIFRTSVVGRVSMLVVGVLFSVSLALSVRPSLLPSLDKSPFYFSDEEFSFYSLHTRAWEILLGVLVALGMRNSRTLRKLGSKYQLRQVCVPASVICLILALFISGTQNRFGIGTGFGTWLSS